MNDVRVVIPYKASGQKSRLAAVLSPTQRRELSECMLQDVLEAVSRAGLSATCCVVTSDPSGVSVAESKSVGIVKENADSGVNSAVEAAITSLGVDRRFLVLPSDLPLLQGRDLSRILELSSSGLDVVISPSGRLDGTNAFLFKGQSHPPLSYDSDSFWRHVEGAARLGMKLGVYTGAGVLFDIDDPRDLSVFAKVRRVGATGEFVRRVMR